MQIRGAVLTQIIMQESVVQQDATVHTNVIMRLHRDYSASPGTVALALIIPRLASF